MLEMIPRRGFFLLAAGALLRAEDRAKRDMVVRSARPEDLEMPLAGFADYITPIEHFFVRTHVYVPAVNGNDWRLRVEGEVATPLTLAMDDLKKLPFPMLSDLKRELVEATGALNNEGVADRVTFIVDPNNEIQFVSVTAGSVGRNVDEVLRVLDALQSDELCACNWRKGDPTLDAGELLKASA